jgi:hypothetical protein
MQIISPSDRRPTMRRRVILRDGSVAALRVAQPADHEALERFFHGLCPQSRRGRFFSLADPADPLIDRLCNSSAPGRHATLLALRPVDARAKVRAPKG